MPKEIVKKESSELVKSDGGLGIKGIEGFNRMDLPVPFLKLVHPLSDNVELASGKRADNGTWFNTSKREAKAEMKIVMFYAKKEQMTDIRNPEVLNTGVRIMAVDVDDLESPFVFSLVKGGYWTYKTLLGAMSTWKLKNLWDNIVVLGSKTAQNKKGDKFLVPTMSLSDPLNAKQKEVVSKLAESFDARMDGIVDIIDDAIVDAEVDNSVPEGEAVKPEDIKLDDLDSVK